jgi:hypothetical protein
LIYGIFCHYAYEWLRADTRYKRAKPLYIFYARCGLETAVQVKPHKRVVMQTTKFFGVFCCNATTEDERQNIVGIVSVANVWRACDALYTVLYARLPILL